ncbi:TPA: hypothetical protein EYP13_03435 [Candidatus Micrarchaeota archaeon]|nr:hypothetical protein [Candidatus Micrarchaeota archaeon]
MPLGSPKGRSAVHFSIAVAHRDQGLYQRLDPELYTGQPVLGYPVPEFREGGNVLGGVGTETIVFGPTVNHWVRPLRLRAAYQKARGGLPSPRQSAVDTRLTRTNQGHLGI